MKRPIRYGKYLLLERISVGGMAEVFKAKTFGIEGFEKIIAIKRILPAMAEDKDFIDMFVDEAKIAGQLSHANICHIFELGIIQDSHFIAMEYVWGKDLLQLQNRFRRMRQTCPPAMACHIARKMCEGLDYAHRRCDAAGRPLEIVHRDLSPQNILVSYEGEVKVIDFGIARAAVRSAKTQAGVLKGKFGYMSPEQVRGLGIDRRSDLFAIGTILYELLIGDRLFVAESDFATLEKVRNVDVPPVREMNPQVPESVERIVMKALRQDPDQRYQWASEIQEDLAAAAAAVGRPLSTKGLAAWMKSTFAAELERERRQLEQYRQTTLAEAEEDQRAEAEVFSEAATVPEGEATIAEDAGATVISAPPAFEAGGTAEPGARPSVVAVRLDDHHRPVAGAGEIRAVPTRHDRALDAQPTVLVAQELTSGPVGAGAPYGAPAATDDTDDARTPSGKGELVDVPHDAAAYDDEAAWSDEGDAGAWQEDAAAPDAYAGAQGAAQGPDAAWHGEDAYADTAWAGAAADGAGAGGVDGADGDAAWGDASGYAPANWPGAAQADGYGPGMPPGAAPAAAGYDSGTHLLAADLSARRRAQGGRWWAWMMLPVVAVGLGLGVGMFLREPEAPAEPAVVVVTVRPAVAADLYLDRVPRGRVAAGLQQALRDLAPGAHEIEARAPGYQPARRTVRVGEQLVEVVEITLEPENVMRLRLGRLADGDVVQIDGVQITPQAAREPIQVSADRDHEVRVRRAGHEEGVFFVKPAAGADQTLAVELVPLPEPPRRSRGDRRAEPPPAPPPETGYLTVETEPGGARLWVDGVDTGLRTPVERLDLPPGLHDVKLVHPGGELPVKVQIAVGRRTRLTRALR